MPLCKNTYLARPNSKSGRAYCKHVHKIIVKMKHQLILVLTLLFAIVMSSCVSKKEMEALRSENAKLRQLNEDTRVELAECNSTTKNLQDRLGSEQKRVEDLRSDYSTLQGSLDKSLQQNSQGNVNIS